MTPLMYISSLFIVSIVALILGVKYSDSLSKLVIARISITSAEQRVYKSILDNDRYSQGSRRYVLTQFRADLVAHAEQTNYKGNIPVQKSLSEYISPTNTKREDPALMRLCINMLEGRDVIVRPRK